MVPYEDQIVLAVECGRCRQITRVPVYDDAHHIGRCGACGQVYRAVDTLVHQYQDYTAKIAAFEKLSQALGHARAAIATALAQWGRKAGKEALARALDVDDGTLP